MKYKIEVLNRNYKPPKKCMCKSMCTQTVPLDYVFSNKIKLGKPGD